MIEPVSIQNPLRQYSWGAGCKGWNLLDETDLSVKQELMPAGTAEEWHYHQKAQQFFYILQGVATFEVAHQTFKVSAGQGLHIPAGAHHKISNHSAEDVAFILCSQPSTSNDRINSYES